MTYGAVFEQDWTELAACKDFLPDVKERQAVFFIGVGQTYDAARKICAVCPVRRACLEDALQWESKIVPRATGNHRSISLHGMAGGHTPEERIRLLWLYRLKESA